ncbi:MAG: O-antigen ligase family protein [Bacteroidetes bacterium]|nr:MAG: O-antigen ligase family protein [Bacteroidota bacterium]
MLLRRIGQYCFFGGNLLIAAGFVWHQASPAFLSLGTIAVALGLLGQVQYFERNPLHLSLAALWVLGLFSGIYTMHGSQWWSITTRQLALFLLPLGYSFGRTINPKQKRQIALVFLANLSAFALISLIRYWIHKSEVDFALTQSGAIPIWDGKSWPWKLTALNSSQFVESGINHIYFSVLQALAIPLAWSFWRKERSWLWMFFLVINLLTIHLFLARTGLMALYGGLAIVAIQAWRKGGIKVNRYILIGLAILPFALYFGLSSVKNKVDNSITDIRSIGQGADINHRSLAMRVEAWKTAGCVIFTSPVIGVSTGDVHYFMQKCYTDNQTSLYPENRIPPHNQYLETTAALGVLGLFALAFIGWYSFRNFAGRKDKTAWLSVLIMAIAFCFESMLQTQVGVCLFPFFLLFYLHDPDEQQFY